jgi:hypothetical protein
MTRDRTQPGSIDDPLGTTDPRWRDAQPADDAAADRPGDDDAGADDAERTIDADPAWFAQLSADAVPEAAGASDEDRTIDVDADLLEHVRAAARAAREGLAAPPVPIADETGADPRTDPAEAAEVDVTSAEEPASAASTEQPAAVPSEQAPTADGGTWSPPAPGAPTSWLLAEVASSASPPPTAAPPAEPATEVAPAPASGLPTPQLPPSVPPDTLAPAPPVITGGTPPSPPPPARPAMAPHPAPSNEVAAGAMSPAGGGRWQPPARLRPAEVRASAPLLSDRPPTRRHLDWRWAALGIVLAVVVGFLIAIAVGGGDDTPDPAPGSTTVPGASTTVDTP